jgi:transcriptional regulator of acetoin/glycerol metabolism
MSERDRDQWRIATRPPATTENGEERFRLVPPNPPVSLEALERAHILGAITWASGNKTLAARVLGIDRRTLHRKLAKYEGKV